jgi:alpha-L-fucosidase
LYYLIDIPLLIVAFFFRYTSLLSLIDNDKVITQWRGGARAHMNWLERLVENVNENRPDTSETDDWTFP